MDAGCAGLTAAAGGGVEGPRRLAQSASGAMQLLAGANPADSLHDGHAEHHSAPSSTGTAAPRQAAPGPQHMERPRLPHDLLVEAGLAQQQASNSSTSTLGSSNILPPPPPAALQLSGPSRAGQQQQQQVKVGSTGELLPVQEMEHAKAAAAKAGITTQQQPQGWYSVGGMQMPPASQAEGFRQGVEVGVALQAAAQEEEKRAQVEWAGLPGGLGPAGTTGPTVATAQSRASAPSEGQPGGASQAELRAAMVLPPALRMQSSRDRLRGSRLSLASSRQLSSEVGRDKLEWQLSSEVGRDNQASGRAPLRTVSQG